jgi:hypothetical protein
VLDSRKKQDGPQPVGELDGEKQRAERDLRRDPLGGKSDAEVADKHVSSAQGFDLTCSETLRAFDDYINAGDGNDRQNRSRHRSGH